MCLQTTVSVLTPPLHVWLFQRKWKHVWNFTHTTSYFYCQMQRVGFSEMLQNGKCTEVLWLKRQTSEISFTTVACCGELVIPPTRKSDSLAQVSPFSLDAHARQAEVIEWFLLVNYSNKYTQNQFTMHVPIEWRSFLYKNKKQNKKKFHFQTKKRICISDYWMF